MNVSEGVDGNFLYNSEAKFACNGGLDLSHSNTIKCVGDGQWNYPQPFSTLRTVLYTYIEHLLK